MRCTTALAGLVAIVALAGCGSDSQPPAAAPASAAQAPEDVPAAVDDRPLRDAFSAATQGAPWAGKVKTVKLDGKAVIVQTELVKGEAATAHEVCEAAYQAARKTGVDFVSIGVRTANDSTLSSRNELRGDVACKE